MSRRNFRKLNGILLLDKALGISSNRALQEARFLFQAEKAGHTGSLDPLACGMLPICFGEATKVSGLFLDADKHYLTSATLGYTSTTGDDEGEKRNPRPIPALSDSALEALLQDFRGVITQIPPMYSALKQDGQPLYKLARQGVEVDRQARQVTIKQLQVLERTATTVHLAVTCSKGTYIRTLVEDIGEALGCGAYVAELRRLWVMPFTNYPMYSLEQLRALSKQGNKALDAVLVPMDQALGHLPSFTLSDDYVLRVRQGQRIRIELPEYALLKLYNNTSEFIGLGSVNQGVLAVKRLLAY